MPSTPTRQEVTPKVNDLHLFAETTNNFDIRAPSEFRLIPDYYESPAKGHPEKTPKKGILKQKTASSAKSVGK